MLWRFVLVQVLFLYSIAVSMRAQTPAPSTPPAPAAQKPAANVPQGDMPPYCIGACPAATPLQIPLHVPSAMVAGRPEFQLCATLPQTGDTAIMGQQLLDGMMLYLNKVKRDPNVAPFSLNIVILDDGGQDHLLRRNIDKLCTKSPLLIAPFIHKEVYEGLPPYIKQQMLFLFPPIGQTALRSMPDNNMFFFRTSYASELVALVDCAITKMFRRKLAVLYEASEWGETGFAVVKEYVKKQYGLELVASGSYPAQTVNITNAVNAIAPKAPNGVICIAQARPAYNFIRNMLNQGLYQTTFMGLSNLFPIQQPLKQSRGLSLVTASVVPHQERSTLPLVQEFRTDMAQYLPYKQLSPFYLEGYVIAFLLCELFKRVYQDPSIANIKKTLETWPRETIKGLDLGFDAPSRSLCQHIWINTDQAPDSPCATTVTAKNTVAQSVPQAPSQPSTETKSPGKQP